MVGWASAGFAEEIELTGLIDLPGCRSACFKLSSKQLEISLHPGERAEGIVLQDLDGVVNRVAQSPAIVRYRERPRAPVVVALFEPPERVWVPTRLHARDGRTSGLSGHEPNAPARDSAAHRQQAGWRASG